MQTWFTWLQIFTEVGLSYLLKCYQKILDIAHIFWMWHSSKEKNTFYNLSNFKSNLLSEEDVIAEILCNFSGRLFSHKFQKFHWFHCNYFKKCWNQHPILRLLKCNLLRESRWNECPTLPLKPYLDFKTIQRWHENTGAIHQYILCWYSTIFLEFSKTFIAKIPSSYFYSNIWIKFINWKASRQKPITEND